MRRMHWKHLAALAASWWLFCAEAQQIVFETVFRTNESGGVMNEADPGSPGKLEKEAKIVDAVFGKALSLPGDIYSRAVFPATDKMELSNELTIGMWVKCDSLPDESAPKNKRACGFFSRGWNWRAELAKNRRVSAQFTVRDADGRDRYFITVSELRDMEPGIWNHIAVTYSVSGGKLSIYLNGEQKASRDSDVYRKVKLLPLNLRRDPLVLGSLPFYSPFAGMIGRTRMYAQALTPEQINAQERDIALRILKQYAADAPELKAEIEALLAQKNLPLSAVAGIQKKALRLRENRQLSGGSSAPLYYGVVNPMGPETFLPDSLPPKDSINWPLRIVAAKNEFEPASFLVCPQRDIPGFLPVLSEFRTKDGKTLPASIADIRIVKVIVQAGADTANRHIRALKPVLLLHDDALVKVDYEKMENYLRLSFPDGEKYQWISKYGDSFRFEEYLSAKENPVHDAKTIRPISLKKHFNRQYWLTVRPPADAAPGLYHATLQLNSEGGTLAAIPVRLRVLPFELPVPKTNYDLNRRFFTGIYYRHNWHNLFDKNAPGSLTSRGRNERQFRAELRNLRDHGVSYPTIVMAFNLPRWDWNKWGSAEEGGKVNTVTDQDRAYFRRCLQILREEGMETRPLFLHTGGNFGFRHLYKSAEHRGLLKKMIEETHALIGHKDIEFYGVDEAHGPYLTAQFEVWRDMREMGAEVFTTSVRTNVQQIAGKISTVIASGVPDRLYSGDMHARGGRIWNYANPQAGQKEKPFPYRVNFGFGVYTANYDGIATYAYNVSAAHPWNDFDNRVEPDLAFVIGTADGVVDTPSWEGYREGIDDIRYATKLREEIGKAGKSGSAEKKRIAAAADGWLDKINVHTPGFDPEWTRLQVIEWILKLTEGAEK